MVSTRLARLLLVAIAFGGIAVGMADALARPSVNPPARYGLGNGGASTGGALTAGAGPEAPAATSAAPEFTADEIAEFWKTPLPQGTRGLQHFLKAISGRKIKPRTEYLLAGVVKVSREGDSFTFQREDSQVLQLDISTKYGADLLEDLDRAEREALEKVGLQAAQIVHKLSAISLNGQQIQVDIGSPTEQRIVLPKKNNGWIPVRLKEIRLRNISMEITERKGHPALKKIEGIVAVVQATAFDLPIEIREFSACKDEEGNRHVHFGVKNLIPGPLRKLFGLPEVISYDYVKKKRRAKASVTRHLRTTALRSV